MAQIAFLPVQLLCQLIASNPSSNITNVGTIFGPSQQQIVTTTSAPPVAQLSLPPGFVAYPDIGSAFKVYTELLPQAEQLCKTEGGHLARIDSKEKLMHAWVLSESAREILRVDILKINGKAVMGLASALIDDQPQAGNMPNFYGLCVTTKPDGSSLTNTPCTTTTKIICELPISR